MRYASLTSRIAGKGPDAWAVHDDAVEHLTRGDDIVLHSVGDPDLNTPDPIRDAAVGPLDAGRSHYAPTGRWRR